MRGRGGRPPKALPLHPGKVLVRALRVGLSTSLYLQRAVCNKDTRHLYERLRAAWKRAKDDYQASLHKGTPDYSHLTQAENSIRKSLLYTLYERTAAYGNTEVRRVKNSDESVGPLNQRLNIGGAVLRNRAMEWYPFPEMRTIYLRDGTAALGYPECSSCHDVVPIHSMPELDFIDSCRAPMQVVNAHCYIYDVPHDDTERYSNLLLLRLKPYLDFIYSEGRYGRKGFRQAVLRTVREIKDDIAANYCVRWREKRSVTSQIEHREPTMSTDFFRRQIREARESGIDSPLLDEVQRLVDGGSITEVRVEAQEDGSPVEKPALCLTEGDVRYLRQLMLKKSGKIGSRVHRRISHYYPSPWSLERVIRHGDDLAGDGEYLLCAEVPIESEAMTGRADLVLFRRESTPSGVEILWRPLLVVEIKTRVGFMWNLGHERKKSKSRMKHNLPPRVVPTFTVHARTLNDSEWEELIHCSPDDETAEQLDLYKDVLSKTYQRIANVEEPLPVVCGTLLLDPFEDIEEISSSLQDLFRQAFEGVESQGGQVDRTAFHFTVDDSEARTTLVMEKQTCATTGVGPSFPVPWVPVYTPLEMSSPKKKRFILYLSARSPTSSGVSAAWISRYSHGLEFLRSLSEDGHEIVWFDLVNEFNENRLAWSRLRLRPLGDSEGDKLRCHSEYISDYFQSLEVVGISDEIQGYIFSDGPVPDLKKRISETGLHKRLIVFSGWDRIHESTPEHHSVRKGRLLGRILDQIPDSEDVTVVWFDSPVPAEHGSRVYSARTLLPFYQVSLLRDEVTEIVWNLPTPPRSKLFPEEWTLPFSSISPSYDDIRVVIYQEYDNYTENFAYVPQLIGWSQRFRSDLNIQGMPTREAIAEGSLEHEVRKRIKYLALDLLPWLTELHPGDEGELLSPPGSVDGTTQIIEERLDNRSTNPFTLLQRSKLRPQATRMGKGYSAISLGQINSRRNYCSSMSLRARSRDSYEPDKSLKYEYYSGLFLEWVEGNERDEIILLEDPYTLGKLLVGHTTESSFRSQTGFVSSSIEPERLSNLIDTIGFCETDYLVVRKGETSLELWSQKEGEGHWSYVGKLDIVSNTNGQVGEISRFRISEGVPVECTLSSSESMYLKVHAKAILTELVKQYPNHIQVLPRVEPFGNACKLVISNASDEAVLQEIAVQSTADIIHLLRLPMTIQGPIHISRDIAIHWDPFRDTNYGDYEELRPFVETNAPREAGKQLPPEASGLITAEGEALPVALSHDIKACPIASNLSTVHERCWRIEFEELSGSDSGIPSGLFTGKETYGLLSKKRIRKGPRTYEIKLGLSYDPSDSYCYVYHENSWIRRLFRENNISLAPLTPGTFLRTSDEQWELSVSVYQGSIEWTAISSLTGFYLPEGVVTFQLNPRRNLDEVLDEFQQCIFNVISPEKVLNAREITDMLAIQLSNLGYEGTSPKCRLQAERDGNSVCISLEFNQEIKSTFRPISEQFTIASELEREEFLAALYYRLEEGDLSEYNILNVDEFLEKVASILEKLFE